METQPQLKLSDASDILERLLIALSGWRLIDANPQEAPYTALSGPDDLETVEISLHDETRFGANIEERLPYSASFLFGKEKELVSDETGLRVRWTEEKKIRLSTENYYEFKAVAEGPDYTCIFISVWSRKPVGTLIREILKLNHWQHAVERHYDPIKSASELEGLIDRSDWLSLKMIKALDKCGSQEAFDCAHQFADFSRKIFQKKQDWSDLLAVVDYIIRKVPLIDWLDEEIEEFYEICGSPGDPGKMNSPQLLRTIKKRKRAVRQLVEKQEQKRATAEAIVRGDHLIWKRYQLFSAISVRLDAEENSWLDEPPEHITQLLSDLQTTDTLDGELASRVAALFSVEFPKLDSRVQVNISLETDTRTGKTQQTIATPKLTLIRPSPNPKLRPTFSLAGADVVPLSTSSKTTVGSLLITFLVEYEVELSEEAETWILNGDGKNPFEAPESFDSIHTGFFTIEPRRALLKNKNKYGRYHHTEYLIANLCFLESSLSAHSDELRPQLVKEAIAQHNQVQLLDYDEGIILHVTGFSS